MSEEKQIVKVDEFVPRDYQIPLINALEHKGKRKLIFCLPRRAGKDVTALNIMVRQAFKRVGVYYYLFPRYSQCRKAVWSALLISGKSFLSFIPDELILKKNEVEMKIWLINGSQIQFNGADKIENLLGTNPVGIVYSEYSSVQNENAYSLMRPILAANGGWVCFVSTPKGHDKFYRLYKNALESDDWYVSKLTVDDTNHIPLEELAKEKKEMSEDMFLQEYYTSFEVASDSSYYSKHLDLAYAEKRITFVPHDRAHQVYTAWDLGWASPSCILFFQVIGNKINVINSYKKSNCDISELVSVIRSHSLINKYNYGVHFAPHDAKKHEQTSGNTRLDIFRDLGVDMFVLPRTFLNDGIEVVKNKFNRIWINEDNCSDLLDALEHYSRKWDPISKRYLNADRVDWSADFCDTFRYMCLATDFIGNKSGEDFDKRYERVVLGKDSGLAAIFNENR